MAGNKGFIMPLTAAIAGRGAAATIKALDEKGQIQEVKNEGHGGHPNLETYALLRPATVAQRVGNEQSLYQWITLEKIKPGGIMDEHYNEYGPGMPIFDIALYVISGRVRVTLGDIEETVGPDTLIYIPSNVKHSLTNVGKDLAKYLAIKVVPPGKGEKMGDAIYTKMPSWCVPT